jgi:hypothetical protein
MNDVDYSVGAIADTVATSDTRILDDDLSISQTCQSVWRTIEHAQWVLAVPA